MAYTKKVTGADCLDFINKPYGFLTGCYHGELGDSEVMLDGQRTHITNQGNCVVWQECEQNEFSRVLVSGYTDIIRVNDNNRVVGLVLSDNADGSHKIALLGNGNVINGTGANSNVDYASFDWGVVGTSNLDSETEKYNFPPLVWFSSGELPSELHVRGYINEQYNENASTRRYNGDYTEYEPNFMNNIDYGSVNGLGGFHNVGKYQGNVLFTYRYNYTSFTLSTDKNNTLIMGVSSAETGVGNAGFKAYKVTDMRDTLSGDFADLIIDIYTLATHESENKQVIYEPIRNVYPRVDTEVYLDGHAFNFLPVNLILTRNESAAIEYIQNGTLPSDAFLYPLDWDNLPKIVIPDSGDDDDDGNPDGTTPDGNRDRDVDPTPLVTPTIVPTMLNANNIYWIGVGRLGMFFTWFWYDIQKFSLLDPTTWDNIFDNIQGLYNNLASAILSIRYYPVRPEWVGGLGNQSRIKLAQIEQDGAVDTISTLNKPPIEKIGSFNVAKDFDSYLDLAPYSQLVLYLPYYGYVDLDIDIFNGHSLDIYATYDILSGTITYYVYYDDTFMLNTYTAKMSVDIPITLQTQYERDRTIQSNITTALSGFMSAGAGALSGNPIGAVLGVNALQASMSPQNTAPIKVEGMLAEQGMFYAPSKCAVILRRPTTTKKGDAFKRNNGYMWCKTETLKNVSGLTICQNPRITFNGAEYYNDQGQATGKMILPLDTEIQEIYELLEKGVII